MKVEQIMQMILKRYSGLREGINWGERGIFYNPNDALPLGAYMLTFKERDGANDSSSNISSRNGVFRLNLKIDKKSFSDEFGSIPSRPAAGRTIGDQLEFSACDFAALDTIMPHPVYGWMSWICVLNPSSKTLGKMVDKKYFDQAYDAAVATFIKKTKTNCARSR